jgi:uncharacterized membrane protein YqjE
VVRPPAQTHPSASTPKSGDLAAEVIHDAQRLIWLEIALAKQELKDLAMANAIAAGMVVSGGLLLILCLLVALPSLVVVLVPWHWQAAVVWVVLYALVGIGLVTVGKSRFELKLPVKTLASLKENKEWALRQMKSTVR